MQYIKLTDDKWICYDETVDSAQVISKQKYEAQLVCFKKEVEEIPVGPTDDELLSWARTNYPTMNYEVQKQYLDFEIAKRQDTLTAISKATEDIK